MGDVSADGFHESVLSIPIEPYRRDPGLVQEAGRRQAMMPIDHPAIPTTDQDRRPSTLHLGESEHVRPVEPTGARGDALFQGVQVDPNDFVFRRLFPGSYLSRFHAVPLARTPVRNIVY